MGKFRERPGSNYEGCRDQGTLSTGDVGGERERQGNAYTVPLSNKTEALSTKIVARQTIIG